MMLASVGTSVSSVASLTVLHKLYYDDKIRNYFVTPEFVKGLVAGEILLTEIIDLNEKIGSNGITKMHGLDVLYAPSGIGICTFIREHLSESVKRKEAIGS